MSEGGGGGEGRASAGSGEFGREVSHRRGCAARGGGEGEGRRRRRGGAVPVFVGAGERQGRCGGQAAGVRLCEEGRRAGL